MKRTIVPRTLKQWLVILIIIVELIMLFMPWISFSFQWYGNTYDLSDLAEELHIVYQDVSYLAEDVADMLCPEYEADTVKFISKKLSPIIDSLRGSDLSPCDLATTLSCSSSIFGRVSGKIKAHLYESEYYDSGDKETIAKVDSIRITLLLIAVLSWGFLLTIVLAAIVAIKGAIRGDISCTSPYLVIYCIYFAVLLLAVVGCNSKVGEVFDDLFGFPLLYETDLLHLTATPFIGAVFAIAAALINKFMPAHVAVSDSVMDAVDKVRSCDISGRIEEIKSSVVNSNPLGGWECVCGQRNTGSAMYCENCGEKRIDRTKCENCGATIKYGSSFCSSCGAPTTWKTNELICPSCGKKLKTGSKFCIYCGSDVESMDSDSRVREGGRPSTNYDVNPVGAAPKRKTWSSPDLDAPLRGTAREAENANASTSSSRLKSSMGKSNGCK